VLNLYVPNESALGSEKYAYKLDCCPVCGAYLEAQGERPRRFCNGGKISNIALEDGTSTTWPSGRRLNGQRRRAPGLCARA